MPLHADVEAVLAARATAPPLSSLTVEQARAGHAAGAAARPPGPAMEDVRDDQVAGVDVRLYRPLEPSSAGLVFFHGGGWVVGSIETHDRQCRLLAAASGASVISVDYRLAPEHPFPAAFDDALAVTTHVLSGALTGPIGSTIDPDRVGVAGDSAGGNLAAAVAIACRQNAERQPRAQLLIYPATDAEMTAASHTENAEGPFLTKADMAWFYEQYGPDQPLTDWRLSPLHAADLTGLPPALVITAEFDPLRDEGEAYANALASAGVTAAAVRYAGVSHGFFGWSHAVEPSRQAIDQASNWLRANL